MTQKTCTRRLSPNYLITRNQTLKKTIEFIRRRHFQRRKNKKSQPSYNHLICKVFREKLVWIMPLEKNRKELLILVSKNSSNYLEI